MPSIDFNFGRPLLPTTKAIVSSGFGRPRPGGRRHGGLDIPIPKGTPIISIADGTVMRSQKTDMGDAGIFVAIQHDKGVISRYMHMSKNVVDVGQQVKQGQIIGYSGETGDAAIPHLHVDLMAHPLILPMVIATVGEPAGGFLPLQASYGVGIPGEPWIPVDGYTQRTINDAKNSRVPLYLTLHNQPILVDKTEYKTESEPMTPLLALFGGVGFLALTIYLGLRHRHHNFVVPN